MAKFWLSSWISGKAPRNIAPNLYHKALRKNISVQEALNNNRWATHLMPITSDHEIKEYI